MTQPTVTSAIAYALISVAVLIWLVLGGLAVATGIATVRARGSAHARPLGRVTVIFASAFALLGGVLVLAQMTGAIT